MRWFCAFEFCLAVCVPCGRDLLLPFSMFAQTSFKRVILSERKRVELLRVEPLWASEQKREVYRAGSPLRFRYLSLLK